MKITMYNIRNGAVRWQMSDFLSDGNGSVRAISHRLRDSSVRAISHRLRDSSVRAISHRLRDTRKTRKMSKLTLRLRCYIL